MAQCEVCKLEQFPANTVMVRDKDGERHFFCSRAHAEQRQREWEAPPAAKKPVAEKKPVVRRSAKPKK